MGNPLCELTYTAEQRNGEILSSVLGASRACVYTDGMTSEKGSIYNAGKKESQLQHE